MDQIILLAAGILALVILYFKARRFVDTFKVDSEKNMCNCGDCPNPCAVRKIPYAPGDSAPK